ncbi:MAG: hypothetical protein CMP09_01985 [Yangia sp.]|nr:hypothetical protein [Salipiger sp.]
MLLRGAIRYTMGLWLAVLLATIAGPALCACFDLPLIPSLLGGVLVLAVYVAWDRLWLAQRRNSRHPCPCPQARRAHIVFARG